VIPGVEAWDAWPPSLVAERLAGVAVPWCVAAGWALDLFRGAQSRPHADLEIAVPAARFDEVAARFTDCDFYVPRDGELVPRTAEAMRASHQTWALESGRWRLDVFREPHNGDVWICRRDERLRRPYPELIERDPAGIPYLAPEIALLFKAEATRNKDEADFRGVLPLLGADRRRRLDAALALVSPAHPWRVALAAG
jgi:hypothetical protein